MNTVPKVEAMPDATSWITRWVRRYLKLSVTPFVAILVFPSPGKPIAILTFRDICLQIPGDGSAQRQLQTTFDDVCKAVSSMTAISGSRGGAIPQPPASASSGSRSSARSTATATTTPRRPSPLVVSATGSSASCGGGPAAGEDSNHWGRSGARSRILQTHCDR